MHTFLVFSYSIAVFFHKIQKVLSGYDHRPALEQSVILPILGRLKLGRYLGFPVEQCNFRMFRISF